ncbi:hypothetical protein POPTR_006G102050v4 [Populus trichocarpa]|uniref:Uncharacterized protein n=1 Tax=Populus trichocarpa TaxID=3694 RepID=A0ACC0STC3_POPTR|nr:hypothetical protein POPTR_006G102050v4 [Populus trichocarpa]
MATWPGYWLGFGRQTCQRPGVRWSLMEDYRCSSTGLCQGRVTNWAQNLKLSLLQYYPETM